MFVLLILFLIALIFSYSFSPLAVSKILFFFSIESFIACACIYFMSLCRSLKHILAIFADFGYWFSILYELYYELYMLFYFIWIIFNTASFNSFWAARICDNCVIIRAKIATICHIKLNRHGIQQSQSVTAGTRA